MAVQLNVTNIKRSVEFYQEIIGLQVLTEHDRKIALTADGKTTILTLVEPENVEPKASRTAGLYHFALLLPARKDLAQFLQHLLSCGIRFGAADHLVSEAIYLDDPDGNGIEVYCDRPASSWTWRDGEVVMTTDPLLAEELMAETDEMWNVIPTSTVLGHVHLHVADLVSSQQFYERLGFSVVSRYPGALFMSAGGYHHHLGLNVWNGVGARAAKRNSVGLHFFDIMYGDTLKRNEVLERLTQEGLTVQKEQDHYMLSDPAGNMVRLFVQEE